MLSKLGPYLKAVVSATMAALTSLSVYYGQDHWFVVVTAVLGTVLVYLTPNTPKPPTS